MKCHDCQQNFELSEGRFKKHGMWPDSTVTRYIFQCAACATKVPIDATTKDKMESDRAPADFIEPEEPPEFDRPPPDCPF